MAGRDGGGVLGWWLCLSLIQVTLPLRLEQSKTARHSDRWRLLSQTEQKSNEILEARGCLARSRMSREVSVPGALRVGGTVRPVR